MPSAEDPKADSAAGVVPAPRASAPWRVVTVEPLPEMRLRMKFVDGTAGEVRLQHFLESPRVNGTVFEPLRDPDVFRQVGIALGTVVWPTGADLAPDAMYDAIQAHGHWVVGDE
jgi:Protein of unknown function (DUF2442)